MNNNLKNIWQYAKKYIWFIVIGLVLLFLIQYLYTYITIFIQYAFNILGKPSNNINLPSFILNFFEGFSEPLQKILAVAGALVLVQIIRFSMRFLNNVLNSRIKESINFDVRTKLYNHIGDLNYSYNNQADVGDLIQRATSDVDTLSMFVGTQLQNFLNVFLTMFIACYQMGRINMLLMLVSLIVTPIIGISSIIWFRYVNKAYIDIENTESTLTTTIQENVNGARVVRAFANERYELDKMDTINRSFRDKNKKLGKKEAFYWGFSDSIVTLQYAVTVILGVYLSRKGIVGSADIIACLLMLGMIIYPMRNLGRIVSSFGKTSVAVRRINEILDIPSEYDVNGKLKPEINGDIEFKDVSFHFDDTTHNLLNNVNFKINSGETIAIVGKTGSGKSTICNLIIRFLETTSGDIFIGDTNIKDIEKHYLRKNIKMVMQDPFLFSKSVYDNITIATDKSDNNSAKEAARTAHIDLDIDNFSDGYDTLVGEKGTTLSGGQKQRIAIARMLVEKSPIIIFDDSLSALDTKTDYLIRKELKKKKLSKTMIIITHRTTTAKEADRIMVLNNGSIEAFDTHENLIKQPGFYSELWEIQGKLETEFNTSLKEASIND